MTIPDRLLPTIHTVCTDMWEGYLSAIADFMVARPEVEVRVVIDRFHIAKNYRDAFDTLRKQEFRRLRKDLPETTYQEVVQGMHWVLRHNHANLNEEETARLRLLFHYTPTLHRAYTLREELTAIFNLELSLTAGQHRLAQWMAKVARSSLTCFDRFLKTLHHHFPEIVNYFDRRASSGFVEGFNNKLKTITRRAYGLQRVDSLFRRLWLDLHGYARFLA